jgi:hypothetical protein
MSRVLPLVLALAACGRVGFDADRGDGGTAPSGDAGFFGAPRCPSDVLLCDSFEEPQIDTSLWITSISKGAAALDTTHAARGTQALHVSGVVTNNEVKTQLIYDAPGAALPSPVYLRVFVYATQLPASSNETWAWLYDSPGNNGVQIEAEPDGALAYDGWGVSDKIKESSTAMPLDRWVCVEWMLAPGDMSMWVDDVAVDDMQDTSWTTPPSPEKVAVGLQYQANPGVAVDSWIDEVIADGARIGCAK